MGLQLRSARQLERPPTVLSRGRGTIPDSRGRWYEQLRVRGLASRFLQRADAFLLRNDGSFRNPSRCQPGDWRVDYPPNDQLECRNPE